MVYRSLGTYYTDRGSCDVGKGISLEFALFITVFVCGLGVAAFLSLSLVVEKDRKVCLRLCMSLHVSGSVTQAVERFSQGQRDREQANVNGGQWEDHKSDDEDESSRLLDEAVREHLLSISAKT